MVAIGDTVQVTGAVSEFNGLTEITVPAASGLVTLPTGAPVTAISGTWPTTDAAREASESMLYQPTGDLTISDTFSTNQFGVVGLAAGTTPLLQSTEVGRPGSPEAAAVTADNAARKVVLDDGASTNFLSAANTGLAPTYVSVTSPVRVGAAATITAPVIIDFRNNLWTLNPTSPGPAAVSFENDRTAAPEPVGGDLRVASFNVLNYFTTLGATTPGCTAFTDRTGDPVTVNTGCPPRGAWDPDDLQRQQDKIVAAINDLDADVVGLLEIENSLVVDGVADEALGTLVDALNAAAGSDAWAYVPSSADLPPATEMDVITNAIIYRPAAVERTGDSHALGTLSADDQAFGNAREPIAQAFTPAGGGEPFLVVVNHLKSKGSAGPWPGDLDTGDGQGASNESRVRQATALRDWVPTIQGGAQSVALVGDFNSYTTRGPAAGAVRRRLHGCRIRSRAGSVLLLVLGAVRLARPRAAQRSGAGAGDRRRHLGDQRGGVDRARVRPVQLPRHAVLRRGRVPVVRPRSCDRRAGSRRNQELDHADREPCDSQVYGDLQPARAAHGDRLGRRTGVRCRRVRRRWHSDRARARSTNGTATYRCRRPPRPARTRSWPVGGHRGCRGLDLRAR